MNKRLAISQRWLVGVICAAVGTGMSAGGTAAFAAQAAGLKATKAVTKPPAPTAKAVKAAASAKKHAGHHKAAADSISSILNHISMVRKAQSMYGGARGGLYAQVVNQPYYTPLMRAQKLLFFGHYGSAARHFSQLLATAGKKQPRLPLQEGLLSALLHEGRQGHLHHFDRLMATVPAAARAQAGIARLLAKRWREAGHLKQAIAALQPCMHAPDMKRVTSCQLLRVYNLYGRILEQQGHFKHAAAVYKRVAKHAVGKIARSLPGYSCAVTQIAWATDRYGVLTEKGAQYHQLALDDFTRAADHDRTFWPAHLAMARLLLANHNFQQGGQQLMETLKLNPRCVNARIKLFSLYLGNYSYDKATEQLAILETISNDPRIAALRGRMLLQEGLAADSIRPLKKALQANPALRRARGWLAGAYYLQNQAALGNATDGLVGKTRPNPMVLYRAGNVVGDRRQYPLGEKLYLASTRLAPWFAPAWEGLSEMYLDDAHERQATGAETIAHHIDPYDETAANELTLLSYLKTFSTIKTAHFYVLYNPRYDTVMAHLAAKYLEKVIYPGVCGDFHYFPKRMTYVEFFPTQSEFSVRIAGSPWVPCIGATTGFVIAMDDSKNGPNHPGRFDWGQVLRHEFTHTVTLALTHNRIPRWLTEGAAVYEQQAPRDWRDCEMLAANYRAGELFRISHLSLGFIKPKRSIDSQLAYMESEWIFQYIMKEYGRAKMLKFMVQFRHGKTQAQAFHGAFGMSETHFYKLFLHWAGVQLARWGLPNNVLPPGAQLRRELRSGTPRQQAGARYDLAVRYLSDGHVPQAMTLFERAVKIDPQYLPAQEAIGMLQLEQHQDVAARKTFHKVLKLDPDRPVTLRSLGVLAMHRHKWRKATAYFLRLEKIRPLETSSYRSLAGIYLMQKKDLLAIGQLNDLQARDQSDDRIPRMLAMLDIQQHHLNDAHEMAFKAIRVDPYNAVNEALVAHVCMLQHKPKEAARYYAYAANLQPRVARFWAGMAAAEQAAGSHADALVAARQAVALDPNSPAKQLLHAK